MICKRLSKKRFRADGFTLIEVMISLTIMAMITTVAFSGLSIGLDSWRRGTKKIDELDARATVERLLKRQLAVAVPLDFRITDEEKPFTLFRGTTNSIDFVSDYSLADGPADLRKIGYTFDGAAFRYDEKRLYGYLPGQEESPQGERLASFHTLGFRFLTENEQHERIWVKEWPFGAGLPIAVEVKIENDIMVLPLVNRP